MLSGGYGWPLFFYVEFAFAMTLLIAAFFIVEETSYRRDFSRSDASPTDGEKMVSSHELREQIVPTLPPRKTFLQQLKIFNGLNHEAPFFLTMIRCFTYLLVPSMFW